MSQDSSTTIDPLDTALMTLSRDGWRLQARTPMTMQVVRPKRFNPTEGWLLAAACIGLVLLLGGLGILIGALLVIGDLVWYAARHDESRLVTLDGLSAPRSVPPTRAIGACRSCGKPMLPGRGSCPRCGTLA